MTDNWRPSADITQLRRRAQLLAGIRRFFAERDVLEVETPLLSRATGTDPNLAFFTSLYQGPPNHQTLYLQTSPEFAMKRLLAAGSGSIYQICKAFRNGEAGRYHNPEFTILEWYRLGFGLRQLMDEVAALLSALSAPVMAPLPVERISYRNLFGELTGIDPLSFRRDLYKRVADSRGYQDADRLCADDHALWLDFLFSHCVQQHMPKDTVCLVYGYPAVQSSLARLHPEDSRMTERFEVFINGVELGNGFFELADPEEQERRFDREIRYRRVHGLADVQHDRLLLDALKAGLPDCSGVAIGLDRLLMAMNGYDCIDRVLAFPIARA